MWQHEIFVWGVDAFPKTENWEFRRTRKFQNNYNIRRACKTDVLQWQTNKYMLLPFQYLLKFSRCWNLQFHSSLEMTCFFLRFRGWPSMDNHRWFIHDSSVAHGSATRESIHDHMSCPHEGNMRYLNIPKLTLCYICMKPFLLLRSYCKFCSHKSHKVIKATMHYYFPFPWYERDYVKFERPYVLPRKYCRDHKGIFIHRTPKGWKISVKMTHSYDDSKRL